MLLNVGSTLNSIFSLSDQVTFLQKNRLGIPPQFAIFGWKKRGINKCFPRVPKLCIRILRGWGRVLKVNLQTCFVKIATHVDGGTIHLSRNV